MRLERWVTWHAPGPVLFASAEAHASEPDHVPGNNEDLDSSQRPSFDDD